jgi:iron(III) transport system permease protein
VRRFLPTGAAVALAVFCLSPILALFAQIDRNTFFATLVKAPFAAALITTLVTAGAGALISVSIALGFSRFFAIYDFRFKRLSRLILLIPYLIPNFVLATAYVLAWNPGTGLLNTWLPFPFGLYGRWGMTVLFAVSHMPIAFLMLEDKVRRLDVSLREAARLSGASTFQIITKIETPLLIPTLLSSFALCFSLNIAAFAIPAWIGVPERAYTLSYKVYQSIQLGGLDGFPQAASYGVVLFALCLPALVLLSFGRRQSKKYESIGGKASRTGHEVPSLRAWWMLQGLFWSYQIFFWIWPLSLLFASTFVAPGCLQDAGWKCFQQHSFSTALSSYDYVLFRLPETRAAFQGSFFYGSLSAVLISILSMVFLLAVSRFKKWALIGEFAMILAASTPGAVIALGLIMIYSGRMGLNLYNTAWIVVLAFIIKHLNLAFQPLRTGLEGLSQSLVEAAQLSGASASQVWLRIILPILRPEIVGGFFIVLIPILGELTMSVFLTSPNFHSIGTLLFDLQDYADQKSAAALSVLLVAAILILNEAAYRSTKGRLGY